MKRKNLPKIILVIQKTKCKDIWHARVNIVKFVERKYWITNQWVLRLL